MVHAATGFAKMSNRLRTLVCTSSIGPGATNMITGAALATINRIPVLLLPGDIFARRNVAPVLQQLESSASQDISANDCFRPVSRYWDRIQRPEQILTSLPEAMRVLTSLGRNGRCDPGPATGRARPRLTIIRKNFFRAPCLDCCPSSRRQWIAQTGGRVDKGLLQRPLITSYVQRRSFMPRLRTSYPASPAVLASR